LSGIPGGPEVLLAWGAVNLREDLKRLGIWKPTDLLYSLWRVQVLAREFHGPAFEARVRLDWIAALAWKFARRPVFADGQRMLFPLAVAERALARRPGEAPDEATMREFYDLHKRRGERRGNPWGRTAEDRAPGARQIGELLGEDCRLKAEG
jgi:hypothetical protein